MPAPDQRDTRSRLRATLIVLAAIAAVAVMAALHISGVVGPGT